VNKYLANRLDDIHKLQEYVFWRNEQGTYDNMWYSGLNRDYSNGMDATINETLTLSNIFDTVYEGNAIEDDTPSHTQYINLVSPVPRTLFIGAHGL
jgi:hypothetical protein